MSAVRSRPTPQTNPGNPGVLFFTSFCLRPGLRGGSPPLTVHLISLHPTGGFSLADMLFFPFQHSGLTRNCFKSRDVHFAYIIYSPRMNKYYIGESENPEVRLGLHNSHYFEDSSTAFTDDWKLVLQLEVDSRIEAGIVERHLKSMKSKKFLTKLVSDSEFLSLFKTLVLQKFSIKIR